MRGSGRLNHLARVAYPRRRVCGLHTHNFTELFFIESGKGLHKINGSNVTISAGDLVLIRPDDEHGFRVPSGQGFVLVNLAFDTRVIRQIRSRYFDNDPNWPGAGDAMPASWKMTPAMLQQVCDAVGQLSHPQQRRLDLDCFLLNVVERLTMHHQSSSTPTPDWLTRAIHDFQHGDDLSGGAALLAELADKSVEHVNRTISLCMNQTTTQLLNGIRLNRAAQALRMTGMPIIDIAMDCGFNNLGYFYRAFKTQFGTTPRQYRKTSQNMLPT